MTRSRTRYPQREQKQQGRQGRRVEAERGGDQNGADMAHDGLVIERGDGEAKCVPLGEVIVEYAGEVDADGGVEDVGEQGAGFVGGGIGGPCTVPGGRKRNPRDIMWEGLRGGEEVIVWTGSWWLRW